MNEETKLPKGLEKEVARLDGLCRGWSAHAADMAQRVADLEAERNTTAAHVASIARQIGDEALQVDDIAVRVLALVAERDELRARLAEIEAQEPVAWQFPLVIGRPDVAHTTVRPHGELAHLATPLYDRPVPAQAAPDGWRLAPVDPTPEMLDAGRKRMSALGMYTAMLAAAPEHKA